MGTNSRTHTSLDELRDQWTNGMRDALMQLLADSHGAIEEVTASGDVLWAGILQDTNLGHDASDQIWRQVSEWMASADKRMEAPLTDYRTRCRRLREQTKKSLELVKSSSPD